MLAVAYVVLMVAFGDTISRPFFSYVSRIHRLATAVLVGLLVSTWLTYLGASWVSGAWTQPLGAGDAVAMAVMGFAVTLRLALSWRTGSATGAVPGSATSERVPWRSEALDWVVIGLVGVFVTAIMVSTFGFSDGVLRIGSHEWGDLGPNTQIAQSFAVGHNYPPQYPLFAGVPIPFHFLFYFQVGNLTFLGLDPATAENLLSIGSLVAMVALVMALGRRLFRSAVIGRLGGLLYFFHGALSFVPYLASFASPGEALAGIARLDHYLSSGFPYRGEEWGVWSQQVSLQQRHLASAIGVVLIVLLFVIDRIHVRQQVAVAAAEAALDAVRDRRGRRVVAALRDRLTQPGTHIRAGLRDPALPGYAACGVILGLLPLWNGAIFIASAALMAALFVVCPNRAQMIVLAIGAAVPAIPQILFLRAATVPGAVQFPALHWGYVVDPPTVANVAVYIAFIFGPKLILIALALVAATWLQRGVFVAASGLVAVAFVVQLSVDIFNNHKNLNLWLDIANVYAAAGLVTLWGIGRRSGTGLALRLGGRLVASSLALVIVAGGLIDLFPIKNNGRVTYAMNGDRLYDWVQQQTKPTDVFLSDIWITHPILLGGRLTYFGYPAFPWASGLNVAPRQELYRQMFEGRNPRQVLELLQQNHIAYVAIDDGLRHSIFKIITSPNEDLFAANFERVFDDPDNRYGHMAIYRVPSDPSAGLTMPNPTPEPSPSPPPVDAFTGGQGAGPGRFVSPRGIVVADGGEILVADTGNHRIERFAADGSYVSSFGGPGIGPGQFNEPNGVAIDSRGHVFVADTANHRLQEFDADDVFVREWTGPEPGFYGPRDVTVGEDDAVYVLDQGHSRVARLAADGEVTTFGSFGSGPGQLNDPTGIAVAGALVFVADATNARIQVFGTDGRFVRSVGVTEWATTPRGFPDVAVSTDGRFLIASSPASDTVLVFTIDGTRAGSLVPTPPDELAGPSALAVRPDGGVLVVDLDAARVSRLPQPGP